MNTTGTLRAIRIAKRMKNLAIFVHLSTAFCYPDYDVLGEKVSLKYPYDLTKQLWSLTNYLHAYSEISMVHKKTHMSLQIYAPPAKPEDVMRLVEWLNDKQLAVLTPSLLGPHPNCYTFSKRLAECIVAEAYNDIPTVITRPSIG